MLNYISVLILVGTWIAQAKQDKGGGDHNSDTDMFSTTNIPY